MKSRSLLLTGLILSLASCAQPVYIAQEPTQIEGCGSAGIKASGTIFELYKLRCNLYRDDKEVAEKQILKVDTILEGNIDSLSQLGHEQFKSYKSYFSENNDEWEAKESPNLDGDYWPYFKILPAYPEEAFNDGVNGYVVVEFTIDKNGSVKDPKVIESKPKGYFENLAIEAVLQNKYIPRVIDGVAMEVLGAKNKLYFGIR